eukprot:snap_masked-scaffold_5-processed-gene-8.37-mRNA-1 protein AED:0.32 eAED:0.32 QI:0/0/0/1/1/1/2/0/463
MEANQQTRLLGGFSSSDSLSSSITHRKNLNWISICLLGYFNVCGGPFGSEEIVSSLGPLNGLVGISFIALCWAFPLSLVTSELSCKFPTDGGYSVWVSQAFGEFWGFQESYWSWISGVIDNAVYPVLSFEIVCQFLHIDPASLSVITQIGFKFGLLFLFTLPVLRTSSSVTKYLAFLITSRYERIFERKEITAENLYSLVAILYWNFSGLDSTSTFAGNVANPSTAYPKGLFVSLCLIILTYALPLISGVLITPKGSWMGWEEGSFITVAESISPSFAFVLLISAFFSNLGMHCAELFEDSWQLAGMAEAGMIPPYFSKLNKNDAPQRAVFASLIFMASTICLSFENIINICNFFSVSSALLELFCFIQLRLMEEDELLEEQRIFKVPVKGAGVFFFMIAPLIIGVVILISCFSSWWIAVLDIMATSLGFIVYAFMKRSGLINYKYIKAKQKQSFSNTSESEP